MTDVSINNSERSTILNEKINTLQEQLKGLRNSLSFAESKYNFSLPKLEDAKRIYKEKSEYNKNLHNISVSPYVAASFISIVLGGVLGYISGWVLIVIFSIVMEILSIFSSKSFINTTSNIIYYFGIYAFPFFGGYIGWVVSDGRKKYNDKKNSSRETYQEEDFISLYGDIADRSSRVLDQKDDLNQKINSIESKLLRYKMLYQDAVAMEQFSLATSHLASVNDAMKQAETDFTEEAFAPFWASIEEVVKRLISFRDACQRIKDAANLFTILGKNHRGDAPQFMLFDISIVRLDKTGNEIVNRMDELVRQAQRNFHFSSIFEQRKTNQILIEGFQNLSDALDRIGGLIIQSTAEICREIERMSSNIGQAVDDVGSQVSELTTETREGFSKQTKAIHAMSANINANAKRADISHAKIIEETHNIYRQSVNSTKSDAQYHKEIMSSISNSEKIQKDGLDMLDNIQHRRSSKDSDWKGKRY